MRRKKVQLIVTFHTTEDAMAMEEICRESGAPGRLIPVPGMISAGCGMAWCADPKDRDILREVMLRAGIREEDMQECLI